MITIQDAINHATDNGVVVGETFTSGMLERKSFRVSRNGKSIKVDHVIGKQWRIAGNGHTQATQAHCILDCITILLDGEPVR